MPLRSYTCLLIALLTTCLPALSQAKSRRILAIEKINLLIRNYNGKDTVDLNAMVDSIAAGGDPEKAEYARLFAFIKKGPLYGDSINNYYAQWAPVFTKYKTLGAKALFKFYYGESYGQLPHRPTITGSAMWQVDSTWR